MVDRRPRPVLQPKDKDKQRAAKLAALRQRRADLPDDETAVFQDEVDINTHPKIGSLGMFQGRQAQVETPGNNPKRYLAGALHWPSGQVFRTAGKPRPGRNAAWFRAHWDDLRSRLRRYHKIHGIGDHAQCPNSEEVPIYLWDHRDRIAVHFLPAYSPDCNPIERIWWHWHQEITRNQQCHSLEELLDLTFAGLGSSNPFQVEGSVYNLAA